ncbi:MAG: HNH endonuclease [Bacteroidia bacterium]|jgi:5-methylcytosine-specific restriction endonuclease McrA|nr:HNH endonuclease [Bacteroidia bacterium]
MLIKENVLVLNQDYQAIGICTAERAFILVLLRKAEMLAYNRHLHIRSVRSDYRLPTIIRLNRYVNLPFKRVNLSRHNVFKRDRNRCVYCGSREALTIDHVIPRSMGGTDSWENLVTACQRCNARKGNMTPEEAGMTLRQTPFRPSFVMFLSAFGGEIHEDWKPYLYMS